jgi:phytoene dehydrogenase-like protein
MLTRRQLLGHSLAGLAAGALASCDSHVLNAGRASTIPGRLLDSGSTLGHRLRDHTLPAPSVQRQARVVVAGAGIAGLSACSALARHGVRDVLLLDTLDAAGGNSSFGSNAISAYPWGAHYVPLVRSDCTPVLDLFEDLKIITDRDAQGRPIYDELYLSADPQERLWIYGRWQEGLVPEVGASADDRAQFARFFDETEHLKAQCGRDGKPLFSIPVDASSAEPAWRALDRITMTDYLRSKGYTSQRLHWYVNYCCRDDYGTQASSVSAWAGLHYFAARTGIAANSDSGAVVTWPEGNGHLVRELEHRAGADMQFNALVTRVARTDAGIELDYFDTHINRSVRVHAAAAVVCLPRFVAARVVEGLEHENVQDFSYAPWMVANVTLDRLPGGAGQALAWDNVIYDSDLLGYVVATHQSLQQSRQDTVLTYYWPLSEQDPNAARTVALQRSLQEWQGFVLADRLRVHPELDRHIENIDVRVWGHAMIRPTPGFIWGSARAASLQHEPPIYFAHSDLSGISIFEEAYCRGLSAGTLAAKALT